MIRLASPLAAHDNDNRESSDADLDVSGFAWRRSNVITSMQKLSPFPSLSVFCYLFSVVVLDISLRGLPDFCVAPLLK